MPPDTPRANLATEEMLNNIFPVSCCLPGYEAQLSQSGVQHSINKLLETKACFEKEYGSSVSCSLQPCKTEEETMSYRCNCTFQVILSKGMKFEYAMRTQRAVVPLQCSYFPIATKRIQRAMSALLGVLNSSPPIDENWDSRYATIATDATVFRYPLLRVHLTSISFTSSWDEKECLVTLHYSPPGLLSLSSIADKSSNVQQWIMQAEEARLQCNATHLSGRSRGIHLSVPRMSSDKINGCEEKDSAVFLHDEITLSSVDQHQLNIPSSIVTYHKPEGTFQHPNPNVMYQALHWLFSCMYNIRRNKQKSISLLEMYCGYGAHTIPLCKTNMCDKVVTIEMDDRLVQACQANCVLNQCSDVLTAIKADAGEISRNILRARRKHRQQQQDGPQSSSSSTQSSTSHNLCSDSQHILQDLKFDVLLVDPPRQGLDSTVCEMANTIGSFQHILYISCGRRALLRDLKLFNETFEVKSVEMLDLFPRTDSVETLVHLQRR